MTGDMKSYRVTVYPVVKRVYLINGTSEKDALNNYYNSTDYKLVYEDTIDEYGEPEVEEA